MKIKKLINFFVAFVLGLPAVLPAEELYLADSDFDGVPDAVEDEAGCTQSNVPNWTATLNGFRRQQFAKIHDIPPPSISVSSNFSRVYHVQPDVVLNVTSNTWANLNLWEESPLFQPNLQDVVSPDFDPDQPCLNPRDLEITGAYPSHPLLWQTDQFLTENTNFSPPIYHEGSPVSNWVDVPYTSFYRIKSGLETYNSHDNYTTWGAQALMFEINAPSTPPGFVDKVHIKFHRAEILWVDAWQENPGNFLHVYSGNISFQPPLQTLQQNESNLTVTAQFAGRCRFVVHYCQTLVPPLNLVSNNTPMRSVGDQSLIPISLTNSYTGDLAWEILPAVADGPEFDSEFAQAEGKHLITSGISTVNVKPGKTPGNYAVRVTDRRFFPVSKIFTFKTYNLLGIKTKEDLRGLQVGETATFVPVWSRDKNGATVTYPQLSLPFGIGDVNWTIYNVNPAASGTLPAVQRVKYKEISRNGKELKIQVSPNSPEGYLWVVARDPAFPGNPLTAVTNMFKVGCAVCPSGQCATQAKVNTESPGIEIPLGSAENGRGAGALHIDMGNQSSSLGSPAALQLETNSSEMDIVRVGNVIRQVRTLDSVVDVVPVSEDCYELRFYSFSQFDYFDDVDGVQRVLKSPSGLYIKPANAGAPRLTYKVCAPMTETNVVEVTQNPGDVEVLTRFVSAQTGATFNAKTWTITEGVSAENPAGLRTTVTSESRSGNNIIKHRKVTGPEGNVLLEEESLYRDMPLIGLKLIRHELETETNPLITIHEYDAVSGNKVLSQYPDGSWERWGFDGDERIAWNQKPWLDDSISTNAAVADCRFIEYSYDPLTTVDVAHPSQGNSAGLTKFFSQARTRTESVKGTVISREFREITQSNQYWVVRTEQAAIPTSGFKSSGNLFTIEWFYPDATDLDNLPSSGRIYKRLGSNGLLSTHYYSYLFTTSLIDGGVLGLRDAYDMIKGAYLELNTTSSSTSPSGVDKRTTWNILTYDVKGLIASEESYVYDDTFPDISEAFSEWQFASLPFSEGNNIKRDLYEYGEFSRLKTIWHKNGLTEDYVYGCCGLQSKTDAEGNVTTYEYDALKRQTKETAHNFPNPGQNLVVECAYDGLDRKTSTTTTSLGVTNQTTTVYDLAGRIVRQTDTLGRTTDTVHDTNARTVTVTGPPSGSTGERPVTVMTRYADGRLKSILGTGTSPEHHIYTYNGQGVALHHVRHNALQSGYPRTIEYVNMLGQTIMRERSAADSQNAREQTNFNAKGLVVKRFSSEMLHPSGQWVALPRNREHYYYDELNQVVRSGVDMDLNHTVTEASMDRETYHVDMYAQLDGNWWKERKDYVYATPGSATKTLALTRREKLTGLGYQGLAAQTISVDIRNNTTTTSVFIDKAARKRTLVVDVPDSPTNEVSTVIGGLERSRQTSRGLVTTINYGPFGRPVAISDPHAGTATTVYKPDGRVESTTDPHGKTTIYDYSPSTKQLISIANPENEVVRHDYDVLGRRTKTWGGGAYPTLLEYDDLGRVTKLHTYRNPGADFAGASWPANAGAGDVTTWSYDPRSGLLASKTDALGRSTTYTYHPDGRLKTRTWARTVDGLPLVTTYTYDAAGEIAGINYSDNTPDVAYTYFRDGPLSTVTDALGSRTFNRLATLERSKETLVGGGGLYANLQLSYGYQDLADPEPTVAGRLKSISTNNGYADSFGFDALGRLGSITSGNDRFVYEYLAGTPVVSATHGVYSGVTNLTRTLTYGAGYRMLAVSNIATQATFSYTYAGFDDVGRRTEIKRHDGDAWHYAYNEKGEVTSGQKRRGTTPFPGLTATYEYDEIGNRKTTGFGGDAGGTNLTVAAYTANALNQYTEIDKNDPIEVRGEASASWLMSVLSSEGHDQPADRLGTYFRAALNFNNTTNAVYAGVGTRAQIVHNGITISQYTPSIPYFIAQTPEALIYDEDGNLKQDGRWTYAWDAENRLTGMETRADLPSTIPRQKLGFKYDYRSRRVQKVVETWNGTSWATTLDQRFVWDGWRLLQVLDANGVVKQEYHWGLDVSGSLEGAGTVGGLLLIRDLSAADPWMAWPVYDGNGNVMGLVANGNGASLAEYEYDAFGQPVRAAGPRAAANPWGFSSKFLDAETELLMYGFRYYDPGRGAWLGPDPLGIRGGVNLYCYTANGAVNHIDPLGLTLIISEEANPNANAVGLYSPGAVGGYNRDSDKDWMRSDGNQVETGLSPYLKLDKNQGDYGHGPIGKSIWKGTGEKYLRDPKTGTLFAMPGVGKDGKTIFDACLTLLLESMLRGGWTPAEMHTDQYGNRKLFFSDPVGAPTSGEQFLEGAMMLPLALGLKAANSAPVLRFTQTTASPWFHPEGKFAGLTISDVAAQLRAGTLKITDVPVTVVGDSLIVNTRSSLALRQAGIPQSQWRIIPGTAQDAADIAARLSHNSLGPTGTDVIRITGSGSGSSTWIGSGTIPPPVP